MALIKEVNKVILIFLSIGLLSSCGYKRYWKGVIHYEALSTDINNDPFVRIVFAEYERDTSYFLMVKDRMNDIVYDTIGRRNDTINELNFYPSDGYQIIIKFLSDREAPIAGINRKVWFQMSEAKNNYKRVHLPYRVLGPLILDRKSIRNLKNK